MSRSHWRSARAARAAGLVRLDWATSALALAALLLVALCGCGAHSPRRGPTSGPVGAGSAGGLALGLTEDNAALLWSPGELAAWPARPASLAPLLGGERF